MHVQSFPTDPEALKTQVEVQRLSAVFRGKGALSAELTKNGEPA